MVLALESVHEYFTSDGHLPLAVFDSSRNDDANDGDGFECQETDFVATNIRIRWFLGHECSHIVIKHICYDTTIYASFDPVTSVIGTFYWFFYTANCCSFDIALFSQTDPSHELSSVGKSNDEAPCQLSF